MHKVSDIARNAQAKAKAKERGIGKQPKGAYPRPSGAARGPSGAASGSSGSQRAFPEPS